MHEQFSILFLTTKCSPYNSIIPQNIYCAFSHLWLVPLCNFYHFHFQNVPQHRNQKQKANRHARSSCDIAANTAHLCGKRRHIIDLNDMRYARGSEFRQRPRTTLSNSIKNVPHNNTDKGRVRVPRLGMGARYF